MLVQLTLAPERASPTSSSSLCPLISRNTQQPASVHFSSAHAGQVSLLFAVTGLDLDKLLVYTAERSPPRKTPCTQKDANSVLSTSCLISPLFPCVPLRVLPLILFLSLSPLPGSTPFPKRRGEGREPAEARRNGKGGHFPLTFQKTRVWQQQRSCSYHCWRPSFFLKNILKSESDMDLYLNVLMF